MNSFLRQTFRRRRSQDGFSLVETTLSLGIMSFGFLAVITLLALGLKTARQARDDRATTAIAQTLIEEARQGTLAAGMLYLNSQGSSCNSIQATYTAQNTFLPMTASTDGTTFLTRLTLRITPLGAPDRARTYAVIYPAPQ